MGIDVRVETESGEVQDEVLDDNNLTEKLLPDREDGTSPCLRFVDPFGDTLFNQIQIPLLITELEKRLRGSAKPDLKAHCEAILKVVTRGRGRRAHLRALFGRVAGRIRDGFAQVEWSRALPDGTHRGSSKEPYPGFFPGSA
jgi:hypothetical protein